MLRLNAKEALKILRNVEDYKTAPVVLFSTSNTPYDASQAERINLKRDAVSEKIRLP